tara:strand:- start:518 stop:991 length:474 start_codon:yes stop_codon:yes gene_type:complete
MKKQILIGLLLLSGICAKAQVSAYTPLLTRHLEKSKHYAKHEGGNKGLIISYERNNQIISGGFLHNSYGDLSIALAYGYTKNIWKMDMSISAGLISGYQKLYETEEQQMKGMPKILRSNNIIPLVIASIRKPIYKNVGIQLNISPVYLNTGIYYKFN